MIPSSVFRSHLVAAAIGALTFLPPPAIAAENGEAFAKTMAEKAKRIEDRMSDRFRDTWKELRNSMAARIHPQPPLSSASVDVREQNDAYTVRVSLPGRDIAKVEVGMVNGNGLRIFAPADGKSGPYEQIVVLDGLADSVRPDVTRNVGDDLIVIHLAKAVGAAESAPEARGTPPKPLPAPPDRWDHEILDRMDRMRREMDELFQQSVKDFGAVPRLKDLFDHPRFGSSVDLREEDGNYIVHAYLPDRDAENIKVTVDDGRILKIEAEAEERREGEEGAVMMERRSHYSQHLTLPGPVNADQLKVDRKDGLLVITVPKSQ